MNCIFCCVFNQEKYVDMFYLLLESIFRYGNLDDNTNILVYTSTPFMNIIKQNDLFKFNEEKIKFEINNTYDNIDKACKARLSLFNLPSIKKYDKIIYLDTDILVKDDINKVFDVCKEDLLYVLEEGAINNINDFWGKSLFGNEISKYKDKTAFTTGILLFNNCKKIKDLFNKINEDIIIRPRNFGCCDQPYIVYNAFKYNLYNNKILKTLVVNNDKNIHSDKVIHHFPGGPGIYIHKIYNMTIFLNEMNNFNLKNEMINFNLKNDMIIYDTKTSPKNNSAFSLIGICVSYNYLDTLKIVLPVNFLHFEKIYLITQKDDIDTINFCKNFDNVFVLFYDFKNNGKNFDKYGAIDYVQKIVYTKFPNSWYLIFDSDIILPNNFIDILIKEELNSECIYGATRSNVLKVSELLNKKEVINKPENVNWVYNDILYWKNTPPSVLGCFQLYKKHCFHKRVPDNALGWGDYYFCHDNFNLFCNLENIIYFHLGETGKNWAGKTTEILHDVNIEINCIYYNCYKRFNNIYYNEKRELVKYGNTQNIKDDIWTCSDKMRYDIYTFFKNNPKFKIAEIGAHKGYTTKILANIFSRVYAVDNSVEWTNFNKNLNKNAKNIEYVMLDIYKDNWNIIPNDVEVSFIDADHSYNGCKSDILNSIKRFTNLKYIIFDDYGVWPGVKKVVDELLNDKTLILEKLIGINDVPGPNGIVKNTVEGLICSIANNKLKNKTYTWGNSYITFLDNFKMDAFGQGQYKFTGKQTIIAKFGGRTHDITFNEDYTSFTSKRQDDLQIVIGNLHN